MRTGPFIFCLLLLAGCLSAESPLTMTSKDTKPATPTCTSGALSACGLPSQVVIDMSKAKVRRTDAEWRSLLSPDQYRVSRSQGTEPPFRNAYWDNHDDGVYVCVGCATPLFDSATKFESGTGWPSFWGPMERQFVTDLVDESHGMVRTEVHCEVCGGHLGHVFDDGPKPTGMRYCINSASLRFLPRKQYQEWLKRTSTAVLAPQNP